MRDWFRETGFPTFFKVSLPNAEILRDEPGEIAGKPAWIAVVYLPGALRSVKSFTELMNPFTAIPGVAWRSSPTTSVSIC